MKKRIFILFTLILALSTNQFAQAQQDNSTTPQQGTVRSSMNNVISITLESNVNLPKVNSTCEVSRFFQTNFFGMNTTGWLKTVKVKITKVEQLSIDSEILEKLSDGTVDGKPIEQLKAQDKIQLECTN